MATSCLGAHVHFRKLRPLHFLSFALLPRHVADTMSSAVTRFVAPFLKGSRVVVPQRAGITSKPAKGNVSGMDTVIGISAFVLAFLLPSGWILSNLENYKKRN